MNNNKRKDMGWRASWSGTFAFALLLCGCVSGPMSPTTRQRMVAEALQPNDRTFELAVPASLLENVDGDSGEFTFASMFEPIIFGTLAITQDSVVFLQWSRLLHHYTSRLNVNVTNLSDVRIAVYGTSQRVVVKEKDGRVNTFLIMDKNDWMLDPQATQAVYSAIRSKL